ncbi:MAG: rhomboid family intramembrane serine protease [bacterium]|nr:rhomboid family intramembrane serine protease [bacterium]
MRLVGEFNDPDQARQFSDYLTHFKIDNRLQDDGEGAHEVWVMFEDEMERAEELLIRFREDHGNIDHHEVARQAREMLKEVETETKKRPAYIDARTSIFNQSMVSRGRLTFMLVAVCVIIFIFSRMGENIEALKGLLITNVTETGRGIAWYPGLPEIMKGEIWRLFTPMLIHFGIWHIVFNMMWLMDLGSMIENRKGTLFLAVFILVVSGISNLIQYQFFHPLFGGMSGVVYGLLGYVWMKGKYDPRSNLFLHKTTVIFMLAWLGLGFLGFMRMANGAHLGGLVVGAAWGYISSMKRG